MLSKLEIIRDAGRDRRANRKVMLAEAETEQTPTAPGKRRSSVPKSGMPKVPSTLLGKRRSEL